MKVANVWLRAAILLLLTPVDGNVKRNYRGREKKIYLGSSIGALYQYRLPTFLAKTEISSVTSRESGMDTSMHSKLPIVNWFLLDPLNQKFRSF